MCYKGMHLQVNKIKEGDRENKQVHQRISYWDSRNKKAKLTDISKKNYISSDQQQQAGKLSESERA